MKYLIFYFLFICLNYTSTVNNNVVSTSSTCEKLKNRLIITGDYVKFSEFTQSDGSLKAQFNCGGTPIKYLSVVATTKVTIDCDFRASEHLIQMTVLAPTWDIFNLRRINLNGKEHSKMIHQAKYLSVAISKKGYDGRNGLHGNPGKNFVGIGDKFINGISLTISVNGGNGQDGGDGGKGGDGEDGVYALKDKLEFSCSVKPIHCSGDKDVDYPAMSNLYETKTFKCKYTKIPHYSLAGAEVSCDCTWTLKGIKGRHSGNGGNSGAGGKAGKPGNIMMIELGLNSGVVKQNKEGQDGKNGVPGKPGAPGGDTKDAFYSYRWAFPAFTSNPKTEYRNIDKLENGVTGQVMDNNNAYSLPIEIDTKQVAFTVSEYKGEAVGNLNLSDTSNFSVQCYYKIDKHKSISNMYDTLSLVDELKNIEKRFHMSFEQSVFLSLYQSLLKRTSDYAKNPNRANKDAEHNKTLAYLYTTILTREYNLKDRSESNLIVDMNNHLTEAIKRIQTYKSVRKNYIIETHRENYAIGINSQTREANNFINNLIIPELMNILRENKENIDSVIERVIQLQNQVKANKQKIDEALQDFKSKMALALACDFLLLVSEHITNVPVAGEVLSQILSINVGNLEDALGLNKDVSLPPPSQVPPGLQILETDIHSMRSKRVKELSELIDFTVETLNDNNSGEFTYLLGQIDDIKQRLFKVTNIKGVSELRKELYHLIQSNKMTNSESNTKQMLVASLPTFWNRSISFAVRKTGKTGKIKIPKGVIFDVIGLALTSPIYLRMFKKWEEKQETIGILTNASLHEQSILDRLVNYEDGVRNDLGPSLEMMAEDVVNVASSLGGRSPVALDVAKWQIKIKLEDVKTNIMAMVKGLNLSHRFEITFVKIQSTIDSLISVFNRIQTFQEQKKLANYIASISTAGFNQIGVSNADLIKSIDYLEVIINCNLVVEQYQTTMDAFKQYVFPFAHSYLKQLVLPSHLNYTVDLLGLTFKAETQLNHIKQKLNQYRNSIKKLDQHIGSGEFTSKYGNSSHPFFVWDQNNYRDTISKLCSGEKVNLFVDIQKSSNTVDAIKFTKMEFDFKTSNKKAEPVIKQILSGFEVRAVHMGNSYFRANGKYYLIMTDEIMFSYHYRKNRRGQPISQSSSVSKLNKGDSMLSPYATWSLQLVHFSERNHQVFEPLELYHEQIYIELIGFGQYIDIRDFNYTAMDVDFYYKPLVVINQTNP